MSAALAFLAASLAVLGAWEALAAVEGTRVAAAAGRALEPVRRAGAEGREPTAPERRRLQLIAAAALLAGGWLMAGGLAAVVAATAGPVLAIGVVRARRRRYVAELCRGAPEAARAIADALGAGHSVRGAVGVAAAGVRGAAGHELRVAARALALGDGTEPVLDTLRRRAGSAAWDTMVAGILLQREAGGDLAALLRDLAASLEAASRAERDARAATAQARFTARLVLLLPAGAALLTELAAPGFLLGLFSQPLPAALVTVSAGLQLVGLLAIRRLARPVAEAW
jgi:tight adherence protein B